MNVNALSAASIEGGAAEAAEAERSAVVVRLGRSRGRSAEKGDD